MLTATSDLETYLARNLRKGQLKVTAANPLPCANLHESLRIIPENIPIHFKLLGPDGYYYHIYYEVLEGDRERTRIDHLLPYRPATLEIDEAMLAPLFARSAFRQEVREENSVDVRTFKQRHRDLHLGDLRIDLRNFCMQFPVVKTETTQPPLFYYSFREYCDYDAIAQYYASYTKYYAKLEEFYREPIPIGDFYLQATNIGLTFNTYEAHPYDDEEDIVNPALFRKTPTTPRIKFRAYVFVQFAFCSAPKTAWDDDDLNFI